MEINNSIGSTGVNIITSSAVSSVPSVDNKVDNKVDNNNVKEYSKPNETTSVTENSAEAIKMPEFSSDDNGYNAEVDNLVEEINDKFSSIVNTSFSYQLHEATNRFVVQIKNSDTGDLLREIPSEKSLDFTAKMLEMAGLLVDEKS